MTDAYVNCPFCDEPDFDLAGLKNHLLNGDCAPFIELPNFRRVFQGAANPDADSSLIERVKSLEAEIIELTAGEGL